MITHPRYGRLWFGFLGAPLAWAVHELAGYPVVTHACYPGLTPYSTPLYASRPLSLGIDVACLVIAIAAGVVARAEWRRHRAVDAASWREDVLLASERRTTRYLSFSGVLFAALFAALIVYSGIAIAVLHPCSY